MADTNPTNARLAAVSGPLALIAFFICGFAFQGWAWAWIFFLVPGVFHAWAWSGNGRDRSAQGQGRVRDRDRPRDSSDALPSAHEGTEDPPPPQRYQG